MKNKFFKLSLNLLSYRIIWAALVILTLTLIPIVLSTYVNSLPILIACAFAVNSLLFLLSVLLAVWGGLFETSNVFILTPAQEQLAHINQSRRLLEKDLAHARNELNKIIGG